MEYPLDVNNIEDPKETEKTIRDKKRGNTEEDDDDLEYTTDSDSDSDWYMNIEHGIVRLGFSSPEAHAAYSKVVDQTKAFDLTCFPHSWVGSGGSIFPEVLCKEYDEATYNRMRTFALFALKSINDQTAYSKTAATTNGRTYKLVDINKAAIDSPNVVVVSMTVVEDIVPDGTTVDTPRTETIVAKVYPDYDAAKDKKVLDWMFYQGSSKDEMTDKNDTRIFVLAPYEKEKKKKKTRHEKRQNTQSWSSTEMEHIEYSDSDSDSDDDME